MLYFPFHLKTPKISFSDFPWQTTKPIPPPPQKTTKKNHPSTNPDLQRMRNLDPHTPFGSPTKTTDWITNQDCVIEKGGKSPNPIGDPSEIYAGKLWWFFSPLRAFCSGMLMHNLCNRIWHTSFFSLSRSDYIRVSEDKWCYCIKLGCNGGQGLVWSLGLFWWG